MRELVINYVPGEECRVAVVDDSKLEEFHAERADSASHVGNIYLGRVSNVEPAIQAAFVDFGLEHNGFLHVSDLHPRYFPGEGDETTELVGKKTPRRDRPPIQDCLKRGQQVLVQVIKEGVGTKGPTVTSYLSIPGRYLVMMPQMDRVGVSRKVEDEDVRKKMRQILDALDLPDGFGFILRTAGFDRTKTELKRDLSYLQRLWRDMEKRKKSGRAPALLYAESDLLVRSLRDLGGSDIDRIVIDHPGALRRASRFLKIVAPRSAASLVRYTGSRPLFHAMGLEQQITLMHSREVPLPSGGRLVIDETEALVAIDVNSGKSRSSKDAETNAFKTNMEAADEICRQIRLRDIGGILVNDLIDMRAAKHRKAIEARFRENLKRDRARTSILQISGFGILQMTRQRMRGSHESQHFSDCPTCRGRGLVQRPDSVSTDAMRELSSLVEHDRIARVEMVVSPRIAGELLSSKRKVLMRIERSSGATIDVRVSEAIPVDRVGFYAYDDRGADVDLERLPKAKAPKKEFEAFEDALPEGEDWAADPTEEAPLIEELEALEEEVEDEGDLPDFVAEDEAEASGTGTGKKRKRRRRRGGRGRGRKSAADKAEAKGDDSEADTEAKADDAEDAAADAEAGDADTDTQPGADGEDGAPKKKRRRRRRRRGKKSGERTEQGEAAPEGDSDAPDTAPAEHAAPATDAAPSDDTDTDTDEAPKKKRRRKRGGRKKSGAKAGAESNDAPSDAKGDDAGPNSEAAPDAGSTNAKAAKKTTKKKKKTSTTKKKTTRKATKASEQSEAKPKEDEAPKKPRTLYAARRKLSASERARLASEE